MVGKAFPLDSLKAALRREKGLCLLSGTAPFRTIPAARQRPKPLRSLLHRLYRKERLGFLCRTLADTGKLHPVDDLPLCFRPVSEKLRQNVLCLLHLRIRSADSGKHIAEDFIGGLGGFLQPFDLAVTHRKDDGISRRRKVAFDLRQYPLIGSVLVSTPDEQGASCGGNDVHRADAAVDGFLTDGLVHRIDCPSAWSP